jgi:hypothetical protein
VEEDVVAIEMWQETEDGPTDGLQFLPCYVLVFVMCSPKAACFEFAVKYRSSTIPRVVVVYVGFLGWAVDVLSIFVVRYSGPPL